MPNIVIPGPSPIDPAAGVPGLRTLGDGRRQALSGAVGAMFSPFPSPTVIERFVRPTGNDTTGDGLTELTAYLTPERAAQDCPQNTTGRPFRINMTGYGTYTPTNPFQFPSFIGSGHSYIEYSGTGGTLAFGIYVQADFELYAEPTVLETLPQGAYTTAACGDASRQVTLTNPGATWTTDQYAGKFIYFPLGYQCGRIVSNTATTMRITAVYYSADYPLESFSDAVIAEESCTIDTTTCGWWISGGADFGSGPPRSITVAGFNFTGGFASVSSFGGGKANFIGCNNLSIYGMEGERLTAWGCHFVDAMLSSTRFCTVYYCSALNCSSGFASNGGYFGVNGCYIVGGDSIGEGNYHGAGDTSEAPRYTSVFYTVHKDTGRGGIRAIGMNQTLAAGYCQLDNCGYGGVRLEKGAKMFVNGPMGGSGNAAGVYLITGDSQILFDTIEDLSPNAALDASNITVTGTNGDLVIGDDLTAYTWTSFFSKKVVGDILKTGARAQQLGTKQKLSLGPGASGQKDIKVIDAGGRASNGSATPLVVKAFSFNPADYALANVASQAFKFRCVVATGNTTVTGHVKLRDITSGIDIVTFNISNQTTEAKSEQTITVSAAGTNTIANAEKVYEVRIYVDTPSLVDDTVELYSAELRVESTF